MIFSNINTLKTGSCAALLSVLLVAVGCSSREKRLRDCRSVETFRNGYALCQGGDGLFFFVDRKGNPVTDKFDQVTEFVNGYALAGISLPYVDVPGCSYTSYFVLDTALTPYDYPITAYYGEGVNSFGNLWCSDGTAAFLLHVKTGALLVSHVAYCGRVGAEGCVVRRVRQNARDSCHEYAILDGEGREVVPFGTYSYIGPFENGRALFSTTGYTRSVGENAGDDLVLESRQGRFGKPKLGYIDETGRIRLPERYDRARNFTGGGYALVSENADGSYYLIDRAGNSVSATADDESTMKFLYDGKPGRFQAPDGTFFLMDEAGNRYFEGSERMGMDGRGVVVAIESGSEYRICPKNYADDPDRTIDPFVYAFSLRGYRSLYYRNRELYAVVFRDAEGNCTCDRYDLKGNKRESVRIRASVEIRYCERLL